jgi:hypothetical protein
MSKSNAFETALLQYIFNDTALGLPANLYVALHSADPGEAGTQTTSEVSYTGYARVAVARSGAGWVVSGNSVSPAASVDFPECTGGTVTATFVTIGTASTGAGTVLYRGALSPSLAISDGVSPRVRTSSTITED